ncbi:MAG: DUF445 family protein [Peptococcaceae bacterium]|jgi:uncharacterized membrane protein YheB (UPF0754 family)|nr:DUF445 family protein [Peptococcaceae bacterium]MDH7523884.1 DUF445 family protein [Peptococcaceae bacterium]
MKTAGYLLVMGLIGAWIGWITNVAAIRLLFRPYRAYRTALVNWTLQGLIPKRRKDIAAALGEVVSRELITGQDVARSLARQDIKEKIAWKVRRVVQERVKERLPSIIPGSMQNTLAKYAGRTLYQETLAFLENPQGILNENELEDVREEIRKIVEEKIFAFDVEQLEKITYRLAGRELGHIELMGGVLGFIIGIIQGLITLRVIPGN